MMARRKEGCRLRKEEARIWDRKPLSRLAKKVSKKVVDTLHSFSLLVSGGFS